MTEAGAEAGRTHPPTIRLDSARMITMASAVVMDRRWKYSGDHSQSAGPRFESLTAHQILEGMAGDSESPAIGVGSEYS
jgi:hypothetical protein